MAWGREEPVVFEGKIEHKSAKSYLMSMTLEQGRYFVPFSQILEMDWEGMDIDKNIVVEVKGWWWGVKEPIDE